jgi:hypothetical protein
VISASPKMTQKVLMGETIARECGQIGLSPS